MTRCYGARPRVLPASARLSTVGCFSNVVACLEIKVAAMRSAFLKSQSKAEALSKAN